MRVFDEMAMALTMPPLIEPIAAGMVENIASTRPPARSPMAGGAPLYGTWVQVRPVIERKSSPARCVKLPLPAEAILS